MAESKVGMKELCNYCNKKTLKKAVKCHKCEKVYHNSCATRVSCCDSKIIVKYTDLSEVMVEEGEMDLLSLTTSNEELLMENQELKQMNKALQEQIKQLKADNNKFQTENEMY